MNEGVHENSSLGCDHQIELLIAESRYLKACRKDTEIRNPENDPFSYFGRRVHVLCLSKIISLLTIPFYTSIIAFVSIFGNATSVMFAIIILGSTSFFTIYGAFRGAKMCLTPFIILQLIFMVYDVILIGFLLMAVVFPNLFLSTLLRLSLDNFPIDTNQALLLCSIILAFVLGPIVWTTHVVYSNFLFISHVDETLHLMKEANQKVSQDDVSPNRMVF